MENTPDIVAPGLAGLYDEPVSEVERQEMDDRLFEFVALLLEIDAEIGEGQAA